MEDVKLQLTKENIDYKHKLGYSFAKIVNTLMLMSRTNKNIEYELIKLIKDYNK